VGWALLSASVNCLQGYIRWDLYVLGAQPLDTSLLGLYQHNKHCQSGNLPQCPLSQLVINCNITMGLAEIAERVSYHLPCHQGVPSGPLGGDPTRRQWTTWSGGWFVLLASWVRASDAQWNTVRHRKGAPLIRLVRTQVQIQSCLSRQKGRLITSQRLLVTAFWGEAMSLRFREWGRSTVLCKSV
jgi:hypothetical protein